jgi:putative endonuclease
MKKHIGRKGEDLAANYLKQKGCKILHRNYRTPLGEADIIISDKDVLVFVEVKARTGTAFGEPFEAVNLRKQERLKRIALYYLKLHKAERQVRFDVVSIISKNGTDEITHLIEAF